MAILSSVNEVLQRTLKSYAAPRQGSTIYLAGGWARNQPCGFADRVVVD